MNDFTKEELKYISDALLYALDILPSRKEILINIRDKTIGIIDNYCKHDFHPVIGSFSIESCHKCMKVK